MRLRFALFALGLFALLACIALFVHDGFVRPFLGDVLAVVWLYAALRAVFGWGRGLANGVALAVAFGLEIGQGLDLLHHLGLESFRVARVVLGATFDPLDLLAYVLGAASVELWARLGRRRALAEVDTDG